MKKLLLITLIFLDLIAFQCERQWTNPISIDEDLKNTPEIVQISLNSENNVEIILNYAYSDSCQIVLERKSLGGFEKINYIRKSQITLVDTSFDKEINHTFIYRVYVKKNKYRSAYSKEKQFIYISSGLNKPNNLVAISVEMHGIRLVWQDESHHEESFKIEKDEGNGFSSLATLPANTQSYFDPIPGNPQPPLKLKYRVKAVKSDAESDWVTISTIYSGLGSPTNLRITNSNPTHFSIEWQDNSNIETGYSIERKMNYNNYLEIAQVGANITSFTDHISEVGYYSYRVRTVKDSIYSSYSNEVSKEITTIIPTDGLIAYYPFNGNANDESGNGNDGTVYGAILTEDRFGNTNSAYSFDGIDDYIFIEYNELFNISPEKSFTICVWVNNLSTNNWWKALIVKSKSNGFWDYGLYLSPDNKFMGGLDNRHEVYSTTKANANWKFAVLTYKNGNWKLYINSILEAYKNNGNLIKQSDGGISFGKKGERNADYFKGFLDDIRIYNRVLSEEEIKIIYHEIN